MSHLRIATEEAYAPPELFERYRKLLASGAVDDPGFESLMGFYLSNPSPRIKDVRDRLEDVGARRLHDMDNSGIDRQILSLTAPGVQVFDAATAVSLAESFNGLYKAELIWQREPWGGLEDVTYATLGYVDWFNHRRLHSQLGMIPPAEFEANFDREATTSVTASL